MNDYITGKTDAFSIEHRLRAHNGNYKWFFCNGIAVKRTQTGEPLLLVGVVYEITRRKSIEQTNKVLAKLPFSNPDSVIIMALDMAIVYINPSGLVKFGENLHAMFPEDMTELLETAYENNRTQTIHYTLHDHIYVIKIKPLLGEKQCMVTMSDITDYVHVTNERNLYYDALQSLNQALFITDRNGQIIHVNKQFQQMYGYGEEEVIGKNPNILNAGLETYMNFGYSEDAYRKLFEDMWAKLGDTKIGRWEGMVINRSKSGKVMWIRSVTDAVFNDEGKITHFVSMPIDITSALSRADNAKRDLYKAISELAELRDNETGAHMRRVGIYAKLIAKELGLPEKTCNDLEVFAPMHDIGKVGIPDNILLAERKLTTEEFEAIKRHTLYGYNIVSKNKEMNIVSEITLSHHEWYDGTGYPYGLKGEDIPIAARIVALCDVYDALRSKRPYKEPWPHDKAMEYIIDSSGGHFDPKVVDAFKKLNKRFKQIFDEIQDDA